MQRDGRTQNYPLHSSSLVSPAQGIVSRRTLSQKLLQLVIISPIYFQIHSTLL